jgi:hypothetical protein
VDALPSAFAEREYRSVSSQPGPPRASIRRELRVAPTNKSPYAMRIRARSGKHGKLSLPGVMLGLPPTLSQFLLSLTEATSNAELAGADCARLCGALRRPATIGKTAKTVQRAIPDSFVTRYTLWHKTWDRQRRTFAPAPCSFSILLHCGNLLDQTRRRGSP